MTGLVFVGNGNGLVELSVQDVVFLKPPVRMHM
jgi:hypothetical protein